MNNPMIEPQQTVLHGVARALATLAHDPETPAELIQGLIVAAEILRGTAVSIGTANPTTPPPPCPVHWVEGVSLPMVCELGPGHRGKHHKDDLSWGNR